MPIPRHVVIDSVSSGATEKVAVTAKNAATGDTEIDANTAGADGQSNTSNRMKVSDHLNAFNGTTRDRIRNNYEETALASAARVASVNSADLVNYGARGVIVVIDVTALTVTGTLAVTIAGKDTLSGKYYTLLASASIVGTGTTVLMIEPGLLAAANLVANAPVPRVWRVQVVAGNGVSITYSVGVNYVS